MLLCLVSGSRLMMAQFALLKSNLFLLDAEIEKIRYQEFFLIGDLNADFSRGKRFEKSFGDFIKVRKVFCGFQKRPNQDL